ncbi:MAG TPA: DUF1553 domain-containing protein [Bryobacteraceae bacterium]|nr:DUF1553 domain-containing protein [Bryobacteraceae bacterium]
MTKYLVSTVCLAAVFSPIYAQDVPVSSASPDELAVSHAECSFFGPQRERFLPNANRRTRLGDTTIKVMAMMAAPAASTGDSGNAASGSIPSLPGGSRSYGRPTPNTSDNLIDKEIFRVLQQKGVVPAEKTNDYEFIRRVTLDLTGRIPTVERLQSFVADTDPNKRANLVDELLGKSEWVDKWTMFYGDMYKSAANQPSAGLNRFPQGRDAFNAWIRNSLSSGKGYDQMARELIASKVTPGNTTFNFSQGELNWIFNGRVTNVRLVQDDYDQMAANTAETFLGLAHANCLLCHNGRGHLDTLSFWGANTSRSTLWGLSAFYARTALQSPSAGTNLNYWYPVDNPAGNYLLNTTTGNRPTRAPLPSGNTVTPSYPFSGKGPQSGETYREALAREVTSDFQFARASVNYLWAEFFGRGIVDPPNQFDPDRLDPANPPPAPWTLQPSHPELLNALAKSFIDSGYDIKALMRLITTSDTYQLSSRYDPAKWNPDWEPLFARKLVRRLWGEEVTDALALSSNIPTTFNQRDSAGGAPTWAMQTAEPQQEAAFQQAFLIGNRDDQPRSDTGNIQQALAMMNDATVMGKVNPAAAVAAQGIVAKSLALSNDDAVTNLYLNILSRYPTDTEKKSAVAFLSTGNRNQKGQELAWSLYNQVDFIFNY